MTRGILALSSKKGNNILKSEGLLSYTQNYQGSPWSYPYDKWRHLISGVKLLACADESGTHGNAKYCVISGYLASPRQWKLFEAQWRAVIGKYPITDFHSKDFFGRQKTQGHGQFDGWPNEQANQLIGELAEVIHQRRLKPVGGAIDIAAFNSFAKGERAFMTMADVSGLGKLATSGAPTRPYQLAFVTFMTEA